MLVQNRNQPSSAKYNVRHLEPIEDGLSKVEVQPPGGNRREILRGLMLKFAGLLRESGIRLKTYENR